MSDLNSAPRPTPEEVEVGVPAAEDIPEGQLRTGDPLEGDMPPLDDPQAVEDWGVTAAEQQGAEPLGLRVQREEPDVLDELYPESDAGDPAGGRLDTLTAEEAAVRIEEEPAGMNYDPDPGYLSED
ncbi:MAG: hypothetical protein M3O23_10970 [Actinomycetota bacterium]|nr:hypothetical protein [Actinomycetota bacterium]